MFPAGCWIDATKNQDNSEGKDGPTTVQSGASNWLGNWCNKRKWQVCIMNTGESNQADQMDRKHAKLRKDKNILQSKTGNEQEN